MNAKQNKFVNAYLSLGDKIAAYKLAYPKTKSEKAIRSAANRLMLNPEVKEAIEGPYNRIRAEAEEDMKKRFEGELLTFYEAQLELTRIIKGTRTTAKWVKDKDGWTTLEVKPTISNVVSALNTFFRLNGHFPQKKLPAELKQEQKEAEQQRLLEHNAAILAKANTNNKKQQTTTNRPPHFRHYPPTSRHCEEALRRSNLTTTPANTNNKKQQTTTNRPPHFRHYPPTSRHCEEALQRSNLATTPANTNNKKQQTTTAQSFPL
jgi:phage terminase small subunit